MQKSIAKNLPAAGFLWLFSFYRLFWRNFCSQKWCIEFKNSDTFLNSSTSPRYVWQIYKKILFKIQNCQRGVLCCLFCDKTFEQIFVYRITVPAQPPWLLVSRANVDFCQKIYWAIYSWKLVALLTLSLGSSVLPCHGHLARFKSQHFHSTLFADQMMLPFAL